MNTFPNGDCLLLSRDSLLFTPYCVFCTQAHFIPANSKLLEIVMSSKPPDKTNPDQLLDTCRALIDLFFSNGEFKRQKEHVQKFVSLSTPKKQMKQIPPHKWTDLEMTKLVAGHLVYKEDWDQIQLYFLPKIGMSLLRRKYTKMLKTKQVDKYKFGAQRLVSNLLFVKNNI